MTDGRTEAAAIAAAKERHEGFRAAQEAFGVSPLPYEQLSERTRRLQLDQIRSGIGAALAAADAWDREHRWVHRVQLGPDDVEVDAETSPDAALGRCQVMLQCHRETGHEGSHEARETLDTGRVPDMDRSKT